MDGEDVNTLAGYFADGDSTLQGLLRTHLILPHILGDFLADHLDEIAGGRIFALEKANNSLRPIVIGSLWRDALHVSALRKCAAMLQLFSCRNTRTSFSLGANRMLPLDAHKSLSF